MSKKRVYKFKVGDIVNGLRITKILDNPKVKIYQYKCVTCGYGNSKNEYDLEKYGCGCCE